jgi:hypothetical protein
MTALHVASPHIANLELREFKHDTGNIRNRIHGECRLLLDHQAPYDAYKNAEQGDVKEAGIELVMLRGTSSASKKKRNSAYLGSSVKSMPKMGRLCLFGPRLVVVRGFGGCACGFVRV